MKTLMEELRPSTMGEFIGNLDAVKIARGYMDGTAKKSGCLFIGPLGCGKTTLATLLAAEYGLIPVEVNVAEKRSKTALREILAAAESTSLDGQKKLLILDEAEGATDQLLFELLESLTPTILTVNEPENLHWKVRSMCHHVVFKRPTKADFVELLEQIGAECPDDVLDQFTCYRDVVNWVEGGDPTGFFQVMSELEQVRRVFSGERLAHFDVSFRRLLQYYQFNGGSPELVSQLDLMSREGLEKQAMSILKLQRFPGLVNIPYRWFPPREARRRWGARLSIIRIRDE